MKLILSRKGFDSSNGGMPSPIFPDGRIVSLPIPASRSPTRLGDLNYMGGDCHISAAVSELSNFTIKHEQYVHLDPDLDAQALTDRSNGWRGAFGQVSAAQRHLMNKDVGAGDLFLFFGWFREAEQFNQRWRFKEDAPNLHVLFGWLLADEVFPVYGQEKEIIKRFPWLHRHPHLCGIDDQLNAIYTGSLTMPNGIGKGKLGFGVFDKLRDVQILTDRTQSNRSLWRLPSSVYPAENKQPMSYHDNLGRWKKLDSQWVQLQTVGRGQEFVLDLDDYPEAHLWLEDLFGNEH